MSRECVLDAVAARNVLKVALASKVAMEDALSREDVGPADSDEEEDPYAVMADMEDECQPDYVQQMPTATTSSEDAMQLDHIVECTEATADGGCDVEEMLEMFEGEPQR